MVTRRVMPTPCPATCPNLRKIASGSDKTTFSFTLKARDRIPGSAKVKVQYFNGQVTMVKDGNTWKISDMSAKKTGEHVE